MGALSILVRLPFAALAGFAGGGDLLAYQLGSIPCVAAAGVLGLAIARWMERRGASRAACIATVVFSMVNPLTWEALALGHPEELLGGALCAGAVLAALRGHSTRAGLLLGLALATKQWALIAVLPATWPGSPRPPRWPRTAARACIRGTCCGPWPGPRTG
jgi:hypothetical protein